MKELEEKNQKQPAKKEDQTKRCRLQASLTIEAAICLPLFLFAAICLIAPIKMLDEKRRLQNLMEGAAKDLSQAIYVQRLIEKKAMHF